MLNDEVISVAKRQIQLVHEEQINNLQSELKAIQADFSRRGVLRSGGYISRVQDACANTVKERASLVWGTLLRCISALDITYDEHIEQQLKSIIDEQFPEHMFGLNSYVQEAARIAGMPNILSKIQDKVGDARFGAIHKSYSDVDLFLLQLKSKKNDVSYFPPQINIHNSNIGALQTGYNSTANVVQKIDTQTTQDLINVLLQLQKELALYDLAPSVNKSEIIELADEGVKELQKEKPNLSKIKSFISTIANTISTVADFKPAYEALKSAAAIIGLDLPF